MMEGINNVKITCCALDKTWYGVSRSHHVDIDSINSNTPSLLADFQWLSAFIVEISCSPLVPRIALSCDDCWLSTSNDREQREDER